MMRHARSLFFLLFFFSPVMGPLMHAGTYTAASCNYTDVSAVINGPTHTAVNGDVIQIPAGTCTWTSTLSIAVGITVTGSGTPNNSPSTFGAGTPTTIIIDNAGSNPLLMVTGITYGQTFVLSLLDIEPKSANTALWSPISLAGTCTSSGCPNVRVNNIIFGKTTPWTEDGNSSSAGWMIRADNVFGVIDHSTMPSGSTEELLNANLSSYLGVGDYGDNSWAQPDTFGGANVLYMENNLVYTNQSVNDCDAGPMGGGIGGCRIAGRFNLIYPQTGFYVAFALHGLDTDNRPQGGRQIEAYGNTINCLTSGGCAGGAAGFRSGTGYVFGNTLYANYSVSGGFYNNVAEITVYRTVFNASPWGPCGGLNSLDPWDTNDNKVYYSGTITSTSNSSQTMTDTSKSWAANQFIPNGAPYSVYDTTQGFTSEIMSNTTNSLTMQPAIQAQSNNFASGDNYEIIRSTVCADQGGRGAGNYVSGSTPSPSSPLNQVLDPIYEWDNIADNLNHGNFSSDTGRTIANRDWYTDNSNGTPQAQISLTSPFNGTSGVGFGTLANRPATCTPRVGYFATDQGNWNQSGNGFGQGELYVCTATNTWTMTYEPYTYPHPLITGTSVTGATPSPPTNVKATVH